MAYAIAAAGLIFVVLRARQVNLGNAALVALLVQQVAVTLGGLFVQAGIVPDPGVIGGAIPFYIVAILLWSPLVWLAGPLLLGNGQDARRIRLVGVAGAAPSAIVSTLFFVSPELVLDGAQFTALAQFATFLVFLGFAFTVGVLAREALTTPLEVRRGQFALLAAAFSVEGMYHAAQIVAKAALGFEFFGAQGPEPIPAAMGAVAFLAFAGIAAWAVRVSLRAADPETRRWARILAAFIGAAALTGVAASPLTATNEYTEPTGAIHALWDLAGIAFIVYAGMRFQLFSLEKRAKQSVAVTAAIGLGFIAFNAAQELAEQVLGGTAVFGFAEGVFGGSASGVMAALMVGAVSVPIGKGGLTIAKRMFPNVVPTEDYERHRKLEIYQAALEGAFADGIETPKEVASLSRLRLALGISDAEHEQLEVEIRVRIHKPLASGQRPSVGVDEPAPQPAPLPPAPVAAEPEPLPIVRVPAPPPVAVAAPAPAPEPAPEPPAPMPAPPMPAVELPGPVAAPAAPAAPAPKRGGKRAAKAAPKPKPVPWPAAAPAPPPPPRPTIVARGAPKAQLMPRSPAPPLQVMPRPASVVQPARPPTAAQPPRASPRPTIVTRPGAPPPARAPGPPAPAPPGEAAKKAKRPPT